MITRRQLNEGEARHAIDHGDFAESVRSSKGHVAVVLTQDWCPQWTSMKRWLEDLEQSESADIPEIDVYELEYNRVGYGSEFMRFKETTFGNPLIPYVRYYRDGRFVADSNYVSKERFLSSFTAG
jgi:hypothetical protein